MNQNSPNTNQSLFPDQQHIESEDENNWQITYLDIFTILLGFLFILLAISNLNIKELSVSNLFKSSTQETQYITTPIEEIEKELENILHDEIAQGKLEVVRDLNDLRVRFSSDELYQSGSVSLQPSALQLLDDVLVAVKEVRYNDFNIDVEGHTDNTPITSEAYPSNWELSTGRASKIVKYFSQNGITKMRLKASGYGDSRPRVPNEDSLGNAIPKNKNLNRRIVLRLYYPTAEGGENTPPNRTLRN